MYFLRLALTSSSNKILNYIPLAHSEVLIASFIVILPKVLGTSYKTVMQCFNSIILSILAVLQFFHRKQLFFSKNFRKYYAALPKCSRSQDLSNVAESRGSKTCVILSLHISFKGSESIANKTNIESIRVLSFSNHSINAILLALGPKYLTSSRFFPFYRF